MIRETTREAYEYLNENNLLSPARMRVWKALGECQFSTASELAKYMNFSKGAQSNQNVVTRLGELRDMGMVIEHPARVCSITGHKAYVWEAIPQDTPIKFERPCRVKCIRCNGKGYIEEYQGKFTL